MMCRDCKISKIGEVFPTQGKQVNGRRNGRGKLMEEEAEY